MVQNYLRQRDLISARSRRSTATRHPKPTKHPKPAKPPKPTRPASRHTQARTEQGPLPTRPLQFGLYLYYRGLIPFNSLLAALAWQRRQRPTIGQVAQRWGWIKEQDIRQILACRKLGRFGERAEHLGLLSSLQVRAILLHQRTRQGKLGSYFVEQGFLSTEEVNRLLVDLSEHNLKYRHGYSHHFYYHH